MPLHPVRSTANTAAEHVADHNAYVTEFDTPTHTHAGTSALLAVKAHNPVSLATYATTSTASVDADATNLAVTFTVPSSGKVLVRLSALGNGTNMRWMVREGTSDVAPITQVTNLAGNNIMLSAPFLITGLTPAASKTYKWGFSAGAGTSTFYAGGSPTAGAATIEVWAAP